MKANGETVKLKKEIGKEAFVFLFFFLAFFGNASIAEADSHPFCLQDFLCIRIYGL